MKSSKRTIGLFCILAICLGCLPFVDNIIAVDWKQLLNNALGVEVREKGDAKTEERISRLETCLAEAETPKEWQLYATGLTAYQVSLATQDWKKAKYKQVMLRLEPMLPLFGKLDDKNFRATAESYLAEAYRILGYNEKAISLLEEMLSYRETANYQKNAAYNMASLGQLYLFQKDYAKAEAVLKQSIALSKANNSEDPRPLRLLGVVKLCQKYFSGAETLTIQGLAAAKRLYGGESDRVVPYMQSLGLVYIAEKRYKEAEKIYKQTLNLFGDSNDAQGLRISTYNNLGLNYQAQGDWSQAKSYYEKALQIQEKYGLNLDSPNNKRTLSHLKEVEEKRPPSYLWDS